MSIRTTRKINKYKDTGTLKKKTLWYFLRHLFEGQCHNASKFWDVFMGIFKVL